MRLPALLVLYVIAAHAVAQLFLAYPGVNRFAPAAFPAMVDGTAARPFVYRALAPALVRAVVHATPAALADRVRAAYEADPYLLKNLEQKRWEAARVYEYLVYAGLAHVAFLVFLLALRGLVRRVYPDDPAWIADLAPCLFVAVLPLFFTKICVMYDPFTLALTALCLWLIATDRDGWLLAAFALAALNKETALVLVPAWWLHARERSGPLRRHGMVAALLAIWAGVKLGLEAVYGQNPGALAQWNFVHNLETLGREGALAHLVRTYVGLAPLALLVVHRWRTKPLVVRQWCVSALVLLGGPALALGTLDEPRQFYELLPSAFLLALPSFVLPYSDQEGDRPCTIR